MFMLLVHNLQSLFASCIFTESFIRQDVQRISAMELGDIMIWLDYLNATEMQPLINIKLARAIAMEQKLSRQYIRTELAIDN
jgi:hypothetical protein